MTKPNTSAPTLPENLTHPAHGMAATPSQVRLPRPLQAMNQPRQTAWLLENRAAINAWNDHVEASGLPLAAFRPL